MSSTSVDLTAESLERAMASIGGPIAATPTRMLVPPYAQAVLRLLHRADDQRWDRRRIKREMRRAETSTYRRKL